MSRHTSLIVVLGLSALAGLAALVCGALLVVARLVRLGFIANFLSRTVLVGFLTGVGVQVATMCGPGSTHGCAHAPQWIRST